MIRVLICDDSAMMRRTLKKMIETDPLFEVAGTARDGDDAIAKARSLRPDVITMDINMPGTDGITAMQYIVDEKIAPVVMVSSLTQEGAAATFEALALGAFDYVGKPGGTVTMDMSSVAEELTCKLKAACGKGTRTRLTRKILPAGKRPLRQKILEKRTAKNYAPVKTGIPVQREKDKAIGFKAVVSGIQILGQIGQHIKNCFRTTCGYADNHSFKPDGCIPFSLDRDSCFYRSIIFGRPLL